MTGAGADAWHAVAPQTEGLVAAAMVQVIVSEQRAQGVPPDEAARIGELVDGVTPDAVSGVAGLSADRIRELARAFSDPALGPGRTLAVGGGVGVSGANATAAQVAVSLLNHVAGNVGSTVDFGAASTVRCGDLRRHAGAGRGDAVGRGRAGHRPRRQPGVRDAGRGGLRWARWPRYRSSPPCRACRTRPPRRPTCCCRCTRPLESWGDSNPRRGVWGLMQPTMRPVFDTRHVGDLLIEVARALGGDMTAFLPRRGDFYRYLRDAWEAMQPVPEPVAQASAADPGTPEADPG